ncbi:MAG: tetratricopeptide repeat protein [Bacteroidaceae bacterium]|nr:tetratricopeptide repeat protein [Bacteroidaceae bacterium]
MTINQIIQWIEHPEMLNAGTLYELRTMVARYPYFQSLRLLYLKNLYLLHDETFGHELRKSVLYVADRRVLFYMIEGDMFALKPVKNARPATVMEEEPSVDRTLSLINSFLAEKPDEQAAGSEMELAADYTGYVLTEENISEEEEETAVSDVTGQEEGKEQSGPALTSDNEELDDSYFTETLAKIYIKQHRYAKALEIIRKLNLKYPKKNIYFADQIRFLEKLVTNEKTKT